MPDKLHPRALVCRPLTAFGFGSSVLLVTLAGCPRADASVEPEPIGTTDQVPDPDPDEDPLPVGTCGTPGQRFTDYDWIPTDSRLTTSILRGDPDLGEALGRLSGLVEQVSLPIRAAMDYRNLGLQLTGLERVLASVELDPGELVELHGPEGDVVWLWPSDCPTTTLATRALDRLAVLVRVDFGNPGVRIGEGSTQQFPFDLVLVRERTVALAPLGRGARIGAWLSTPARHQSGSGDGPGIALASIELAPIRSVLSGPALLSGIDGEPISGPHRRIRATAGACFDLDAPPTTASSP